MYSTTIFPYNTREISQIAIIAHSSLYKGFVRQYEQNRNLSIYHQHYCGGEDHTSNSCALMEKRISLGSWHQPTK